MDDGLYGFAAEHGFLAPAPAFSQRKSLKGSLCLLHVFYKQDVCAYDEKRTDDCFILFWLLHLHDEGDRPGGRAL